MECAHVSAERNKAEQLRANLDAALGQKTKRVWENSDVVKDMCNNFCIYLGGKMYWLDHGCASSDAPSDFNHEGDRLLFNLRALLEQGQLLSLNRAELERAMKCLCFATDTPDNQVRAKLQAALAACREREE
jgi:hypothetical protein